MQPTAPSAELARLLLRCGSGDRGAFERLYRLQAPRLYGLALRITRDQAAASDAVQETMLQVWRNASRYDPERGSAEAWLIGLVRYRALDIARRGGRETPTDRIPDTIDDSPDPLARLLTTADGAALARCLRELPEDRRRLIRAAFADGLSHSDLAAQLGEPLGTVKSWIRRTLLSLKKCLTQ